MTDCINWQGHIDKDGYGRAPGGYTLAHRRSYEAAYGPIPEGLVLDHLCRNRACVNPEHLEPVTHAENCRRAAESRPTCGNGHPWTDQNTYIGPRGRQCRACNRASVAAYRARRKTGTAA